MPAHRKHPRPPQRHDPILDEAPRTRYGRGAKSAPTKDEKPDAVTPKPPSQQSNGLLSAKKSTRSASNVSPISPSKTRRRKIQCKFGKFFGRDGPSTLRFSNLPPGFLEELAASEERKLKEERIRSNQFTLSDLDETDADPSDDSEVARPARAAPSRGRGRGRGGRGGRGRGRGSRSRGRGGRQASGLTRDASPLRARKARNAAPVFPLTEEDDEGLSNQDSPIEDAKESPQHSEDEPMPDLSDDEEEEDVEDAEENDNGLLKVEGGLIESTTPLGSPPSSTVQSSVDEGRKPPTSAPQISLPEPSVSQTPQEISRTPAATPTPIPLNPEDDLLSDSDLPDPFVQRYRPPKSVKECEDQADFLLQTRYKPMTDVQQLVAILTKLPPAQRSTETLYLLAENTQRILQAWQDEYLKLDARTAPHAHPPKKPANGGRIPVDPLVFEDMKEADLYGYTYDPKKAPGTQDPFLQRPGAEKREGRELRQRRARDMLDSAAPTEDEEDEDTEGRGVGRRQRRATRRFDLAEPPAETTPPVRKGGWGGARKKGVSKFNQLQEAPASATPEPDGRAAKRAKTGTGPPPSNLLHQRIQEMREESAVTSSGDEASSNMSQDPSDAQQLEDMYKRRGRPAGSKNVGRRSDYGVKKGPRRRHNEALLAAAAEQSPNIPPQVLQSISEGQNQFSIDPQPVTPTQQGFPADAATPPTMPQPNAPPSFQAAVQPPMPQESASFAPPERIPTPDMYMNTTPLSQYNQSYADNSDGTPGSGSRRGKPKVKSEKRSHSMTIWWKERKARETREKELLRERNGGDVTTPPVQMMAAPPGTETPSRPGSKKGSRPSTSHNQFAPMPVVQPDMPSQPQFSGPSHPPHVVESMSAPSPNFAYAHAPPPSHPQPQYQMHMQPQIHHVGPQLMHPHGPYTHPHLQPHPPPQLLMQPVQPAQPAQQGPFGPMSSAPPPPSAQTPQPTLTQPLQPSQPALAPFQPQTQRSSDQRPLAPAPMPAALPSYPSPYGPRTVRKKNSNPPPLAPAPLAPHPTHSTAYPNPFGPGPTAPKESPAPPPLAPAPPPTTSYPHPFGPGPVSVRERDEPYKLLFPAPPPPPQAHAPTTEERRM